jgi:hypothetical protein
MTGGCRNEFYELFKEGQHVVFNRMITTKNIYGAIRPMARLQKVTPAILHE